MIFVDHEGKHHGKSRAQTEAICAGADLFIDLSGGCWFWRDEYRRIPCKIFIDSDPAFTQSALAKGEEWYVEFFKGFDALFTFGRNLGADDCTIPETSFKWHKTWQPIVCDEWSNGHVTPRDLFTTVMTWKNQSFDDADGNKISNSSTSSTCRHKLSSLLSWRSTGRRSYCAHTAGWWLTEWRSRAI